MNRRVLAAGVLGVAVLLPAGCARKPTDEQPVAKPGVTLPRTKTPLGGPIDVTYRWVVAPNAPRIEEPYRVFVHFLDANEELMWTDDHELPVPTTKWTPGQTIEYTRTVFIPIYPYVGDASIRMGLHSPRNRSRLPLIGEENGQRAYRVATLQLLPQSDNVFLIFKEGWHPAEVATDNAAVEWQWTRRNATISFRNPKRDAVFYLHLDGRPDVFQRPQQVNVSLGDRLLGTIELATRDEVIRKFPIGAAEFGTADMVDVKLSVDQTFVPAQLPGGGSRDPRELGVRVFHAFIEPK